MITVHMEPKEIQDEFPRTIERCYFCRDGTRFWDSSKRYPVCQECAQKHDEAELHATTNSTGK